jgi:hypothetical protein
MKEIIFSFILIITFSTFGKSQMLVSELGRRTHLRQLKMGVLLVQLPNSDKKIKILRDQGKEKRAKKEEKEINKIRKEIIEGFQQNWNFSEILFIESKNSKEVFNRNPDFLLDASMNSIKDFPKFEHIYSVRYGPGNPNGEVYRYNGIGFQIRYIKDGELQTIKYDTFYHAIYLGFFIKIFNKNKSITKLQIEQFNIKLNTIKL